MIQRTARPRRLAFIAGFISIGHMVLAGKEEGGGGGVELKGANRQ